MKINLQNIEEIIFFDKKIHSVLSEFAHYFDQWTLSKRVPGLQNLGKRTIADLLNSLESEQILKLKQYFNEEISVEKVDYHIIKNEVFPIEVSGEELCRFAEYKEICCHRDKDKLYISMWK